MMHEHLPSLHFPHCLPPLLLPTVFPPSISRLVSPRLVSYRLRLGAIRRAYKAEFGFQLDEARVVVDDIKARGVGNSAIGKTNGESGQSAFASCASEQSGSKVWRPVTRYILTRLAE